MKTAGLVRMVKLRMSKTYTKLEWLYSDFFRRSRGSTSASASALPAALPVDFDLTLEVGAGVVAAGVAASDFVAGSVEPESEPPHPDIINAVIATNPDTIGRKVIFLILYDL